MLIFLFLVSENSDAGPMIVYSMYKEGHNNCKGKKIGTYQVPVSAYLKAHAAEQAKEASVTGAKYEGQKMQDFLYCQAAKINNVYVSRGLCRYIDID